MDKNNRILAIVFLSVIVMVGLSFAAVPAYKMFCQVTGFNGTTQRGVKAPDTVLEREITVQFNGDVSNNLPWRFTPDDRKITVHIGQEALTSFTAESHLDRPTVGSALYNVTPLKAGKYFHKIQCFCFGEQMLQPGQKVSMPITFYIDPEIAEDKSMDDVHTITLSYTFFPAESEELDAALEAFYNDENIAIENSN
jgi:cytochrome c oxidase assembly protein subunit 11